eukprot:m.479352 g.479352  ORF g.479352 m.479352 type:complete len:73 (+) comp21415_c0_seq1:709-927(+)
MTSLLNELVALTTLTLTFSRLMLLLPEIGQLGAFTELSLGHNALTCLPLEIGRRTSLAILDLGGQQHCVAAF